MIAESPVMASVCNTFQHMSEFYSCPQNYLDDDDDLNSVFDEESVSGFEGNVSEIEGLDSLFSLGVSDTERLLCDNLLVDSNFQYVFTSYQYEMNSEPSSSLGNVSFDYDDDDSSSQSTRLADSAKFDMATVCDTNRSTASEQLKFIHKKCLRNGRCQWHQLTPSEQTSVIMALSNLILQLGPRERVEVLKLLNRKLSHVDMDSLIDPSWITEKNIKSVVNYLKSHKASLNSVEEFKDSQKPIERRNRKKSQKRKCSKADHTTDKMFVQAVKEKKSGFFQKEIVVPLSLQEASDEEVDIDIIG
ncbi:uncharacterized protein LOC115214081 [Argonauta hians]